MDAVYEALGDRVPSGLPLMEPAWAGCIEWAAQNPNIVRQYNDATGENFQIKSEAFETRYDLADSAQREHLLTFLVWVTDEYWGGWET